mmetsp:Transcript_27117/g.43445  ORF Transcript_27117/g.43445 Transcript_27117/m.43445 type:complete len:86 (+) Transcript_27117:395-652(+)
MELHEKPDRYSPYWHRCPAQSWTDVQPEQPEQLGGMHAPMLGEGVGVGKGVEHDELIIMSPYESELTYVSRQHLKDDTELPGHPN